MKKGAGALGLLALGVISVGALMMIRRSNIASGGPSSSPRSGRGPRDINDLIQIMNPLTNEGTGAPGDWQTRMRSVLVANSPTNENDYRVLRVALYAAKSSMESQRIPYDQPGSYNYGPGTITLVETRDGFRVHSY